MAAEAAAPAVLEDNTSRADLPEPAEQPIDNSFAWTLAFGPLLGVLTLPALYGLGVPPDSLGWSAAAAILVINTLLVIADSGSFISHRFQRQAVILGLVFVPAYLFARSKMLRQKYAIPLVWCICLLTAFAAFAPVVRAAADFSDAARAIQAVTSESQDRSSGETPGTTPKEPVISEETFVAKVRAFESGSTQMTDEEIISYGRILCLDTSQDVEAAGVLALGPARASELGFLGLIDAATVAKGDFCP